MSREARIESGARAPIGVEALPPWLAGAAIVLLTIGAYFPALVTGGFIWDDDSYVTQNALLWEDGGLRRIWWPDEPLQPRSADADSLMFAPVWFKPATPQYYPVVFTTFWLEHRLWGLSPRGYHAVNILLHAANAVLLWLILARLKVPGAWLVGAVFAVHPIHVESVAWITERKNTLSLLFYLLAAMAYLKFEARRDRTSRAAAARGLGTIGTSEANHGHPPHGHALSRAWADYALSLILFILALLSKSVTCSLPAALILVFVWLRVPLSLKRLALLVPFFVIGFVLAMNTALIERELVGARGDDFKFSFAERSIIASRALLFYVDKHVWPHPLVFIYPRWAIDETSLIQYLPLLFWAIVGGVLLWLLSRGVRGPFVAISLFAGTAFPALGYFNVYPHIFSFVADHFVYHASIGLTAFIVGGGVYALRKRRWPRSLHVWVAAPMLLALGALTFNRSFVYQSEETVYRDTIARNPAAWMPHNNLSTMLIERAGEARDAGDSLRMREHAEEAIVHAEAAIAARPQNHRSHSNRAEALRLLGRFEEALASITTAIAMIEQSVEPEGLHIEYTWQRGRILHHLGRYEEAIEAHLSAVGRDAGNPAYRHDLAVSHLALEQWAEAAEQLERIHAMRPDHFETMARLGAIRQRQGDYVAAQRFLRLAVEHAPTIDEQFAVAARLVRVLATAPDPQVRSLDEAMGLATRMAEATGFGDPGVLSVLASVHAEAGDVERAAAVVRVALTIAQQRGMQDVEAMLAQQLAEFEGRLQQRP